MVRAAEAAFAAGDLPRPQEDTGERGGVRVQLPPFNIDIPREKEHGDFAVNIALVLAGRVKMPPRQVAEILVAHFDGDRLPVARLEVAGPGFINVFLETGWQVGVVRAVLAAGDRYGHAPRGTGRRILVEFVSANPTGPLNVVNARAAAFGDALAAILAAAGHEVEREYYINDAGSQFAQLALAMEARARQILGQRAKLPEGAYPGEYVLDLAREFLVTPPGAEAATVLGEHGPEALTVLPDDLPPGPARARYAMGRFAVDRIVASQRESLLRYGVSYDRWTAESEVRDSGGPDRVLERLRAGGHLYEHEGAVWFRSTDFGDDQDRVLVRGNGKFTYFLVDVAYHLDKLGRGYDQLIDIWGQDHHGYVPRLRAALTALGYGDDRLEVLLNQIVRLVRGGKVVRMSKRRGEFVTMDELVDDVGRDAARFLFLMRSIDSHMDFDLDLARLQAAENPVYYVQYAHARICSILRQAEAEGHPAPDSDSDRDLADPDLLAGEAEQDLMRKLGEFPGVVSAAAAERQPHRLTVYARELATVFHAFYGHCRVLVPERDLAAARLALVGATRQVLANALSLLGVSAPERM